MSNNNRTVGLILDLDGTLIDTLDDITLAVNHAVAPRTGKTRSREWVRSVVGAGVEHLVAAAAETDEPDAIAAMVEVLVQFYRDHYLDHTRLYDGWESVLDDLVAADIPLAVLSNKPDEITRRIAEHLLARWPFVHIEGALDDQPLKPDPTRAMAIAEIMNLPPTALAILGDSQTDIGTAQRAGMTAVAATWGFRDRDQLEAAAPNHLIDHPNELVPLLRRLAQR